MESHGDAEEAHPFAKKWPHKTHTSAAGAREDARAEERPTQELHPVTGAEAETTKAPPHRLAVETHNSGEEQPPLATTDREDGSTQAAGLTSNAQGLHSPAGDEAEQTKDHSALTKDDATAVVATVGEGLETLYSPG